MDNAAKKGLLVPAEKGQKQLSAMGEQYVLALPDKEAAHSALVNMRRRRRIRKIIELRNFPPPKKREIQNQMASKEAKRHKSKRIAIFNHKGGVGKTTLTLNIASALSFLEERFRWLTLTLSAT